MFTWWGHTRDGGTGMARFRRTLPVALIALVVLAATGCTAASEVAPATPSPATAPAAAPPSPRPDLRRLLLDPADIPIPGMLPPSAQPLAEDAIDGLTATFDTADGERQLGVTIVLLPDPGAAQEAMLGAAGSTQEQRTDAVSAEAAIGDRAVVFTGYELAGTTSTMLLFSQGRASVAMEFRSPSTAPIPTDAVLAAGTRQAARLQAEFG